jgi:hypothetical protein
MILGGLFFFLKVCRVQLFFLSNMVVMSTTIWKVANSGFRSKDEVQTHLGRKTKSKIKGFTICTLHRLKDEVQNQGVYNLHFALDVDNGLPKLDSPKHIQENQQSDLHIQAK